MMVNYLAVYTESKNDSPGFSIWDTRQQALDAKVPKGMVLWDVMEIKDDATFGAEGVAYTGNYQTDGDYNPYKYVNEAPFGSEDWTRPKKDVEVCPDFRKYGNNCFLKTCKVCAKEGRTPEKLREVKATGWFTPQGHQKGIRDTDFGIVKRFDRGTSDRSNVSHPYNLGEYFQDAEEKDLYSRLETEPMNMKGGVGMFIAIVGILLWKA